MRFFLELKPGVKLLQENISVASFKELVMASGTNSSINGEHKQNI